MIKVIETDEQLTIADQMQPLARAFLLLLALIPLLAPYELMLVIKWQEYLHPFFFLALFISGGALVVSGLFVWAAVAGLNSVTHFRKSHQTITHRVQAPMAPMREWVYQFKSIKVIEINKIDWSDGAPSYILNIVLEEGHECRLCSSWSQKEMEDMKERLTRFLG